jgi:predicted NBD/HSP70 family sugar kinase
MKVLVVDIGGNNVKILATDHKQPVKFPSGRSLTPDKMVDGVKKLAANWRYDVVSIGVPGPVLLGQLILSNSSTMPPCRLWAVTEEERCSSSGLVRGLAQPW